VSRHHGQYHELFVDRKFYGKNARQLPYATCTYLQFNAQHPVVTILQLCPRTRLPIQLQRIHNLRPIPFKQGFDSLHLPFHLVQQVFSLPILILAQLLQMHLIRPIHQSHCPPRSPHARQRELLRNTTAAVCLDRLIDHLECHAGDVDFRLGDLNQSMLRVDFVDLRSGVEHDEASSVDLDPAMRDPLNGCPLTAERFAERGSLGVVDASDEVLQSFLGLYLV
jgi:hypothetical protein